MTCDDVRPRLTAYLDGDLDPDRGTVVRGHLRTCDACREVAAQEAVLRDGLRDLPTVDPPTHLWATIQHQLAAAEVAESERPAWKRALARWAPMLPRFAMGGALAAAAITVLWWRTHDDAAPPPAPVQDRVVAMPSPKIEAAHPVTPSSCNLDAPAGTDVTADLAGEAARITACYAQTASELRVLATDARGSWSAEDQHAFDAQVASLQQAIDAAEDGRPRQRAYRALNRYLQITLTRDRVALASGTP